MGRSELASRLTLNCVDSYVEPQKLQNIAITIIDVSIPFNKSLNGQSTDYITQEVTILSMDRMCKKDNAGLDLQPHFMQ